MEEFNLNIQHPLRIKPPTQISVEKIKPIKNLGTEPKYKLNGKIKKGSRERDVQFIERSYDSLYPNEIEQYTKNWKLFKSVGLPVPSVLRKTEDGGLIVSDVSIGDKNIYGKAFEIFLRVDPKAAKESLTKEQVGVYTRLIQEDFEKIESEAKRIAEQAAINDLLLPTDDPCELVVHPDGKWEIMILDLTLARKTDGSKRDETLARNIRGVSVFLLQLKEIQEDLKNSI